MPNLAIKGGNKSIKRSFKRYNPIGEEENHAVMEVMKSGELSQYIGAWVDIPGVGGFYGGAKVNEFERMLEKRFKVKHAITLNSATSALIAAIGAIGIAPGDEVIVSPWTMCASATSIIWWNAIPVFADIEEETFNLDPKSVMANITKHTKAIIVPDIFGHPAQLDEIMKIAKKYNLTVLEDSAQSPTALYKGKYAGTVADIGILSLNYHKHIHTGEGGICLTNNSNYAEKIQMIRNHAEAVVEGKGTADLSNMIGFNFRLGEIESAIGIEQFKKIDRLVSAKVNQAERLSEGLGCFKHLRPPVVKKDCTHVYYVYPIIVDCKKLGYSKDTIFNALIAEGIPIGKNYTNIHLLPMYQKKIAYGSNGYPWKSNIYRGKVSYDKGICPVAEDLNENRYFGIGICTYDFSDRDIEDIIKAFQKVWMNLTELSEN
ncbi:MAG TPA: DegT/DnrJ/EryC1/StrS family aminotransferase [Victivallales bacterium]|nr:DegT/DnrJ/EryC1/StrS family aminotransferase [Victivallales bacterium]